MAATEFPSLRKWFVVHFLVDMSVAIPLFFYPSAVLRAAGFGEANTVLARIIAAAFFGIGIESFLGRKAGPDGYRGMLRLKIIWSAVVVAALWLGMMRGDMTGPVSMFMLFVFAFFNLLWSWWYHRLSRVA